MAIRVLRDALMTRPGDGKSARVIVEIVEGIDCDHFTPLLSFIASGFGRTVHFFRALNPRGRLECEDSCYAHVNVWLQEDVDVRGGNEGSADYQYRYSREGFLFPGWREVLCYYLTVDLDEHERMIVLQPNRN